MTLGKSLNLAEPQLIIAIIPASQVIVRIKRKVWQGTVQMLVLIIPCNYDCSTGGVCVREAVREGGYVTRLCVRVYCVWVCLENQGPLEKPSSL